MHRASPFPGLRCNRVGCQHLIPAAPSEWTGTCTSNGDFTPSESSSTTFPSFSPLWEGKSMPHLSSPVLLPELFLERDHPSFTFSFRFRIWIEILFYKRMQESFGAPLLILVRGGGLVPTELGQRLMEWGWNPQFPSP